MPLNGQLYEMVSSEAILPLFNKRQYNSAIKKINELLFQKRLAPQRQIEGIILISSNIATPQGIYEIKLTCRIVTEFRVEFFAFFSTFDVPISIGELQAACNRAGCTTPIEFNE